MIDILVAGPGGAPGLEDYAIHVILSFLRVSDYISPPSLKLRRDLAYSLYGLSPIESEVASVLPFTIWWIGFHRYSQIFIPDLHLDGPILSLLCDSTLPRGSVKELVYYS